MNFDNRQNPIELELSYDLLKNFVQDGLRLGWDEPQQNADHGEMNIIVLRGAKPIADFGKNPPNSRQEIQAQWEWDSQEKDRPIIRLVNNIHNQYNDVIIWVWQDSNGNKHIRALAGSADPGQKAFDKLNTGARQLLVGYVGAGEHKATWVKKTTAGTAYESLEIYSPELTTGKEAYGYRRRYPNDPDSEVQWGIIHGAYLHAAGNPSNTVGGWSKGCIVQCGSYIQDPHGRRILRLGNLYKEIMGSYEYDATNNGLKRIKEGLLERIEEAAHKLKKPENPQNKLRKTIFNTTMKVNVIVWNAWALAQFNSAQQIGASFRPVIPMGAHDPSGAENSGWVRSMQRSLRNFINTYLLLPENWNLIVDKLPNATQPANINPDGKFGPGTLRSLRACQQICANLINQHFLRVDENVDVNELRWECRQWLCGPETWKLLETKTFVVGNRRVSPLQKFRISESYSKEILDYRDVVRVAGQINIK